MTTQQLADRLESEVLKAFSGYGEKYCVKFIDIASKMSPTDSIVAGGDSARASVARSSKEVLMLARATGLLATIREKSGKEVFDRVVQKILADAEG